MCSRAQLYSPVTAGYLHNIHITTINNLDDFKRSIWSIISLTEIFSISVMADPLAGLLVYLYPESAPLFARAGAELDWLGHSSIEQES